MPQSNAVDVAGWRGTVTSTALLVVAIFSALMLFSFGGQIIVAPALLPAQWLIARHTKGTASMMFSVLGGLLAAELVWIALAVVLGGTVSLLSGILVVVAGLAAGFLFFRTSRPGKLSD
jgi:hypothetical protein